MNRTLLAVLGALLLGALGTVTLSQETPPPSRVAFCDVQRVFEEYRKRKDVEERLNAQIEALQNRFKQMGVEIEQQSEQLKTLNPGSDEYIALERDVDKARYLLKRDREVESRRLERQMNKERALIYKEICREAQALGEGRGHAAVLLWVPLGAEFDKGEVDLSAMMATRTVLWRDDRLDVTDDLIQTLNASLPPPAPRPTPPGGN